jgi:hypothetical protein
MSHAGSLFVWGTAGALGALTLAAPAQGQQSDAPTVSVERVRRALQSSSREMTVDGAAPFWVTTTPGERRFGPLTFVAPAYPGEIVSVRVPIGELAGGLAHKVAAARHRRAEAAARAEVARELAELAPKQAR